MTGFRHGVDSLYNCCTMPIMVDAPDSDFPPGDGLFPIRHVCAETGINPVTLRAWERRYGLVRPLRTAKGHRLYSAADITRIKRILALIQEGVAVSQVSRVLNHDTPDTARAPPPAGGIASAALAGAPKALAGVNGGVAPHVQDPVAETLLQATEDLSSLHLERTYARLVMRHGWEGVHEHAFLDVYRRLRERARTNSAAEARLAVFATWAMQVCTEQLRATWLLSEGPACPSLILGTGHRRLSGMTMLLASARQGLRILPLLDMITPAALQHLTVVTEAPALLIHAAARPVPGVELDRLVALLAEDSVPAYLCGSGIADLARVETPRSLVTLPTETLAAARALRQHLEDRLGADRLGADRLGADRLGADRLGADRLRGQSAPQDRNPPWPGDPEG